MAFLGLLIYFFCLYIRPQDWVTGFVGLPVDYIIFALVFLFGFFQGNLRKIPAVLAMRQTKSMVWWIVAISLSSLTSGDFSGMTGFLLKYGKFLLIFIAFAITIDSFSKMKFLFIVIIALTAALGFQAMYQVKHGVGWAGQPLGWLDRVVWVGLWDGMNVLCLLFVVSFPFLLQFLTRAWSFRMKIYALAAMPVILTGIYLTQSRGGFMSLLAVFLLHFRARIRGVFGLIFGVVVVGAFVMVAPSRFGNFNDEDNSAAYRVDMWQESFEMVRYDPIFGIGKGRFLDYTGKLIAHNSFLEIMGETGMFGLFCWLSLIYAAMKGLLEARSCASNERERSLMEGLLICITGYLFTSFFITAEFELLYVLLAMALVAARLKAVVVQLTFRDIRNVLGIQFAGMTVFFLITRFYYQIFA